MNNSRLFTKAVILSLFSVLSIVFAITANKVANCGNLLANFFQCDPTDSKNERTWLTFASKFKDFNSLFKSNGYYETRTQNDKVNSIEFYEQKKPYDPWGGDWNCIYKTSKFSCNISPKTSLENSQVVTCQPGGTCDVNSGILGVSEAICPGGGNCQIPIPIPVNPNIPGSPRISRKFYLCSSKQIRDSLPKKLAISKDSIFLGVDNKVTISLPTNGLIFYGSTFLVKQTGTSNYSLSMVIGSGLEQCPKG